ncbi:disease resistance Aig2 protein [Rutstroemia sp. NJR-2017a BBW]|nr:disease resistance Aig2 protein [Rutstroemia sp. NJR-2017a BBW]
MAESNLPTTYNAFFYGTLMAPEVLYRVLYNISKTPTNPSLLKTITPAVLPDYCRHKVRYADYPGIVAESGHTVRGTYVTGLTPDNVRNLDLFEGSEYVRKEVTVRLLATKNQDEGIMGEAAETGEERPAQTYVFLDRTGLESEEWDFEYFKREKLRNWVGRSEEYAEVDAGGSYEVQESKEEKHDPTGGRGVGGAISQQLKDEIEAKYKEKWMAEELSRIREQEQRVS